MSELGLKVWLTGLIVFAITSLGCRLFLSKRTKQAIARSGHWGFMVVGLVVIAWFVWGFVGLFRWV